MASIVERITELADRVVEHEGIELVDVEYLAEGQNWVLRVFIDKPDPDGKSLIGVDDCHKVSSQLSGLLDVHDIIPQAFRLEVSSPGIERPLRKPEDYNRFAGSPVKLRLQKKWSERRRFSGRLGGYEDGFVTIKDDQGEELKIPFDLIDKANLQVDF